MSLLPSESSADPFNRMSVRALDRIGAVSRASSASRSHPRAGSPHVYRVSARHAHLGGADPARNDSPSPHRPSTLLPAADGDESRHDDQVALPRGESRPSLLLLPSLQPLEEDVKRSGWRVFYASNKGVLLVVLAQFFGSLMNVTARLLETQAESMHPLQILFARMSVTSLLCMGYMWYARVPHFPFGSPEIRGLLVARGIGGFIGVFGLYYSLVYLPIAEATVLIFLAPVVSCWACSIFLHEPFTRAEQIGAFVSLAGVVLIARPTSLFSALHPSQGAPPPPMGGGAVSSAAESADTPTPSQRLIAVGVGLLGVMGAACAYTTIRWIGARAHALITVTHFALWSTVLSILAFALFPSIPFRLPHDAQEWGYLVFLGATGFIMQILLTAGLQHEKSSRATNMVYTQMLFALAFDKLVWGTTPSAVSLLGSALILGSALWVAVRKSRSAGRQAKDRTAADGWDEEAAGGGVGRGPGATEDGADPAVTVLDPIVAGGGVARRDPSPVDRMMTTTTLEDEPVAMLNESDVLLANVTTTRRSTTPTTTRSK
ncbi:MAG: hypothetical protein M1826_001516 [Phylliscum demangeonii]|nr:MAG: hypothetical protein M1826_001516 [Phylliscum demangeonii]